MISMISHEEYGKFVNHHLAPHIQNGPQRFKLLYLLSKLASEGGETLGEICKMDFHDKPVLNSKIIEELGDITWYIYSLINMFSESKRNFLYKDMDYAIQKPIIEVDPSSKWYKNINTRYCYNLVNKIGMLLKRYDELYGDGAALFEGAIDLEYVAALSEWYYELRHVCCAYGRLINLLNYRHSDILQMNMDKIEKRHGKAYNPEFYTKGTVACDSV